MDRKVEPLLGRLGLVQGNESSELLAPCKEIRCTFRARHGSVKASCSSFPRVQQTHTVATAVRTAMGDLREAVSEAVLTVNDHQVYASVFERAVLRSLRFAYSGRVRMSL